MRRLAAMMACLGLLSACATAPAASGEPEDPFVLQIDSGRLMIFVDRIGMASELIETPASAEGTDLTRAARNVRQAAIAFLAAKDQACEDGKFTAQSCIPLAPPAWLSEAPNRAISAAEVRRRIDDVYELTGPLVEAACEAGKAKSGDGLFCSVE